MKKTERKDLFIFQLNDKKAEFEEIEIPEDKELYEILDSSFAILILNPLTLSIGPGWGYT